MINELNEYIKQNRKKAYTLFRRYLAKNKRFLLRSDLWDDYKAFCEENNDPAFLNSPLAKIMAKSQEAAIDPAWLCLDVRPRAARWQYLRLHMEGMTTEEISISEFLKFKERLVEGRGRAYQDPLEIDVGPLNAISRK